MSLFTSLYGSGAGAPIGAIVAGNISPGGDWLALDGQLHNKADYPELDTSKMLTFDGQSFTTGATFSAAQYRIFNCGGNVWYAAQVGGTNCRRSTDNGVTWTSGTMPATSSPSNHYGICFAGSLFFMMPSSSTGFTSAYYTSPDGLTWTARNPITGNALFTSVAYIAGRYVALPTRSNNSGSMVFAMYSTDGITWIYSNGQILGNNQSTSNFGVDMPITPVSPRLGIVIPVLSSNITYFSQDGVNWTSVGMGVDYGPSSTVLLGYPHKVDAFDNFVDQTYVLGSASTYGIRTSSRSSVGLPLAASNIHLGAPGNMTISEDHGITTHRFSVPNSGVLLAADFNGSRFMCCNSSGTISYMDVSTTKFRAARIPTESSDVGFQKLYIKAR